MRPFVFSSRPKFCVAFKPSMIRVRCGGCGAAHQEYFGPDDRDELGAELELLHREADAAASIVEGRADQRS